MNRQKDRRQPRSLQASDVAPALPDVTQLMPEIAQFMNIQVSEPAAGGDGESPNVHDDPERSEILLAACRIVISGYRAEISRGRYDSLFVRAAYQLLHHLLERQFASRSRAA